MPVRNLEATRLTGHFLSSLEGMTMLISTLLRQYEQEMV